MPDTWTQTSTTPVALAMGQTAGTVIFPTSFAAVPYNLVLNVVPPNGMGAVIKAVYYALSQNGFSFLLSGPPPDSTYTLTWTAQAFQPNPCPPGSQPGGGCAPCGNGIAPFGAPNCGPGQGWACPPVPPQMWYMQGLPGQPGPLGNYAGIYSPTSIYFSNAGRADIVYYQGYYWVAINTAKNNSNTWGTPLNGSADWLNIGPYFVQNFVSAILQSGQISNTVAVYNPADPTRTEPKTAYAAFTFGAVANPLPVTPLVGQATDASLTMFGWQDSTPGFVVPRFANPTQAFMVAVSATGENTNASGYTMTGQLVYALQTNGGGFGAWVPFGNAITTANAGTGAGQYNLSTSALLVLTGLTGVTDVKFGFQYQQSHAGNLISLDAGQISVLALN